MQKINLYIGCLCCMLGLFACGPKDPYMFELLEADQTGLDFSNELTPTKDFNIFRYMYFYNGGGIGAGDLNNDGKIDLVFTANIKDNKIYLNKGEMSFEDVTEKAHFTGDKGWSNGVSIVDINQDGMLDIYVSQVGDFEVLKGHNLLFVCQEITPEGIPVYAEKSKAYGLDLVGFGTQAAFFDYDLDGDLDMFQLNHSVHQNGTFGSRTQFKGTVHPLAGDRFFRNDAGKFVEITQQSGIASDALGYGLGIGLGDVNFDGYPDMYIGNDFHENDYLYINQKNGTFKDDLTNQMGHTSQYSMGVDVADLNNDTWADIVSMDMLPYDREILKRSEGDDSYTIYNYKIQVGYGYQYARNNVQINNGNGTFSEIGLYSNVFATDWSWSPLLFDFDNDGRRDLFVSNGIPKRVNDMDYINFISSEEVQNKIDNKEMDDKDVSLDGKIPEIKIPNKFFKNTPSLQFLDEENLILNNKNSYSNGAVYADLDNDGDLDVVTNNINDKVFVYKNLADQYAPQAGHITLSLQGSAQNRNAIGTKVLVFKGKEVIYSEKFPVKAFQASMEIPLTIGVGEMAAIDSMYVIWPDQSYQKIDKKQIQPSMKWAYQTHLPPFDFEAFKRQRQTSVSVDDATQQLGLNFTHQEIDFNDFEREALMPNKLSSEGPALAVADINHDGLEDVFVGSSRETLPQVFLQKTNGKFQALAQKAFVQDSIYEEIDAQWADINADGHLDLVVAEGGNQYVGASPYNQPRAYLNDGKGNLQALPDAFKDIFLLASSIEAFDFTGDGKVDLFVGARAVAGSYGKMPRSYLLQNDGKGHFKDVTATYSKELLSEGLVKNAELADLDKDGDKDLLLSMEWDGIYMLENQGKGFVKRPITSEKGWWNFTYTQDFDLDGDLDIIAGNLGLNSRLKASASEPVKLYVHDFDKNGTTDQLLTYYLGGKEILFSNKIETQKQFPLMKKKFLLAKDFAKAEINDLVDNLADAQVLESNHFQNMYFENDGKGNFTSKPLPFKAQWTPYFAAQLMDANHDKLPDVLLLGNYYDCNVQMGRYDADYGTVLINKGKGQWETQALSMSIKGQVKRIVPIQVKGVNYMLVARNNDTLVALGRPK